MALNIVVTNSGVAEIINAEHTGTAPVLLSQIKFGSGQYAPQPTQTQMVSPFKTLTTFSGADVGDQTIHVTVRDDSTDSYTLYEVGLYTASGTLFAVYSQSTPVLQKTANTVALLSIDIQLSAVQASSITFGDTTFLYPPATTETAGVAELATPAEVIAGLDNTRVVTPLGLQTMYSPWTSATTGRINIPGGILLQWGSNAMIDGDGTTLTFPAAYNHACIYVGAISAEIIPACYRIGNLTNTQVTLYHNANGSLPTRWIALGY